MTPHELLRETQRAVGGDEMLKSHDRMIELWNEHKTISEVSILRNILINILRTSFGNLVIFLWAPSSYPSLVYERRFGRDRDQRETECHH